MNEQQLKEDLAAIAKAMNELAALKDQVLLKLVLLTRRNGG